MVKSGEAFGWLVSEMISRHIWTGWDPEHWGDPDKDQDPPCAQCCGVCAAFFEYFSTERGRGVTDTYLRLLPKTSGVSEWQNEDFTARWDYLAPMAGRGGCPNHEEE